ncbi:IS1595 family transposase [Erythrobacter sp. NE805]|uniref:IS1595 family transposase n=1 Tax=Erythrobacter sp. NE805 TaxID=3389875 RepID=UPI00396B2804
MRGGILEFCNTFPDEDACLDWVFKSKFGGNSACPGCGRQGKWTKIKSTKKYMHHCRLHISVMKDTPFYRTNIPLTVVFYCIFLFCNSNTGIRGSFLRKQLALSPKAAHRLANSIRLHMAASTDTGMIGGAGKLVEADEVLLRHVRRPGCAQLEATIVQGFACDGEVRMGIVADRKRATLHANIVANVRPGSTIVTDDWAAYRGVEQLGFKHITVNHSKGYFNEQGYSTCEIDSCWGALRRAFRGYQQVAPHNLWLYLAEFQARYNLRRSKGGVFENIIASWPTLSPAWIKKLEGRFDWRRADLETSLPIRTAAEALAE